MSEQIDKLAEALALAQGSFKNPTKDCENPYFHSRYASLDALQEATREGLSKNGLCVTQVGRPGVNGAWELHTMLLHSSGQFVTSAFPLTAFPKGSQAVGSEITYMRRYAYAAMLNITADQDDDANGAERATQGNVPDPNKLPQRPEPQTYKPPRGINPAVLEVYKEATQSEQREASNGDQVQGEISDIGTSEDGKCVFCKIGPTPTWTRDRPLMVQLVKMQGQTVQAHVRKKTPESKSYQLLSFVNVLNG